MAGILLAFGTVASGSYCHCPAHFTPGVVIKLLRNLLCFSISKYQFSVYRIAIPILSSHATWRLFYCDQRIEVVTQPSHCSDYVEPSLHHREFSTSQSCLFTPNSHIRRAAHLIKAAWESNPTCFRMLYILTYFYSDSCWPL